MSQEPEFLPGRDTAQEKFVWRVNYEDSTILSTAEDNTLASCKLPRAGLRSFEILENEQVILHVKLLVGDKFALRKRTTVKSGLGLVHRLYAVGITRDDMTTYLWLSENDKSVTMTRLAKGEDSTGLLYAFGYDEADDAPIT
jgi:hypothetical protein